MRQLVVTCALMGLLALPALALGAARDGTLSVKNATGLVAIVGRGALIGHCDRCTLTVTDPDPTDGPVTAVTGVDSYRQLSETKGQWCCDGLRFKVVGGFFRIRIVGTGIDVSAVATGSATLDGGTAGTYSIGGSPYAPMPGLRTSVQLGG